MNARMSSGSLVVLFAACTPLAAGTASIGLGVQSDAPRVVKGAVVGVNTNVENTAPFGSDSLKYNLSFNGYGGNVPAPQSGVLAPSEAIQYLNDFDTSSAPFGANAVAAIATDANATNSPQAAQDTVMVLDHAHPELIFPWISPTEEFDADEPIQDLARSPEVSSQQAGATGGDHFAAANTGVGGEALVPTAKLDLDWVTTSGDPQITSDFSAVQELRP